MEAVWRDVVWREAVLRETQTKYLTPFRLSRRYMLSPAYNETTGEVSGSIARHNLTWTETLSEHSCKVTHENFEVMIGYEECANPTVTFTVNERDGKHTRNTTAEVFSERNEFEWDATPWSTFSSVFTCDVPKHMGGVYPITLTTNEGRACQPPSGNFFEYEAKVLEINPPIGSKYGGQIITISGYGFDADEDHQCSNEVRDVSSNAFDYLDLLPEPADVEFCYRNYTTFYHNDTYFQITCDATDGSSRYTEFADSQRKNDVCNADYATCVRKRSGAL